MKNIPATLTKDEIDVLVERCNFTINENILLNYRRTGRTLEECAELMNYSVRTVSNLNNSLNRKLRKVFLSNL